MKGRLIALDHLRGREAAALMVDGRLEDFFVEADAPAPGTIWRAVAERPMKGQGGLFLSTPAGAGFLREGKGGRLLISGVNPVADADDLRRATGAEQALFDCCIDIDHAALDTIGNAAESARWAAENGFASAILVTNNYHMPRSLLEMRRADPSLRIVPYPVVNTPLGGGEWLRNPEALRVLFTEYTKYLAALTRGVFGTPGSSRASAG